MGLRRGIVFALALVAASLVVAPAARAGVEVGNDCQASGYAPDFTLLQLEGAAGNPLPLAASSAGVVTSWKVNSGLGSILAEKLRVFRATGGPNEFRTIADSRNEAVLPGGNVFHTRIPVRGGDRFGVYAASPSGALYCAPATPADVMGAVHFDAAVGSTHAFTPNPSFRVALSAVVEPDADRDGYGDETQDRCPGGRPFHRECPRVRVRAIAKERRRSILLFVTLSSEASVHVYGQVGWRSKPAARWIARRRPIVALNGGTRHIETGATSRFKLPLPKSVLRRLGRLAPSESLIARLTVATTDFAGRVKNRRLQVKLGGRAGPV